MKVAIFAGPTGGHFFPAFAFLEAFKNRHPDAEILFVTGERGRFLTAQYPQPGGTRFEFLPDFPFPRPKKLNFIVEFFFFLIKLTRAFLQSGKLVNQFQPDLCVGFGSYVAFPGIWIGRNKKIPTLIHEQNQRVGRANAWLARLADRMAVSFKDTEAASGSPRLLWTGLPLRSSLLERASQRQSFPSPDPEKFTILVLGGSQGASSLNRLWSEAVHSMSREEISRIAVIHITGNKDFEGVRAMYLAKEIEAMVSPFYEKMEDLYPQTHLAITRAGASTLFELALFELPAVIFPYPHADTHQELNARSFEKEGAIVFFSEKGCTGPYLKQKVFQILDAPAIRNRMVEGLRRIARPDASEKLVDAADELLSRETCLT